MDSSIDIFDTSQKAIDFALWQNFLHRAENRTFGVISGPDDDYIVTSEATRIKIKETFIGVAPKDYEKMEYGHIESIKNDHNPLRHLEEICGVFSTVSGEFLRFILYSKLPIEKWIRYELASRGYDENMLWVGFDRAKDIWLT